MLLLFFVMIATNRIYEIFPCRNKEYKLMKDEEGNVGLGKISPNGVFNSDWMLKEIAPGEIMILSGKETSLSLHFDGEELFFNNKEGQTWTISFSSKGAFRISHRNMCLNIDTEFSVKMQPCDVKDTELFFIVDKMFGPVLRPYVEHEYKFKRELKGADHEHSDHGHTYVEDSHLGGIEHTYQEYLHSDHIQHHHNKHSHAHNKHVQARHNTHMLTTNTYRLIINTHTPNITGFLGIRSPFKIKMFYSSHKE